jgi:hypothetical protein
MTTSRHSTVLATARSCKQELLDKLFGAPISAQLAGAPPPSLLDVVPAGSNVLGVGFGVKETLGTPLQGETALRVYVKTKLPRAALSPAESVPAEVQGVPTDVIAVGDLSALVSCGASVGHHAITAGTAGCLVERAGSVSRFVLSNNHVLANSSDIGPPGGPGAPSAVGDDILQPGPLDGGTRPADVVAQLSSWVPLDFTGAPNTVDAAIAEVTRIGHFTPDISHIGKITLPPIPAVLYQSVRKWGRTTNHSVGVIMDLAATIRVRYGTKLALFDDQLGIQGVGAAPFSAGGDSGSLIVDAVTKQPVGLLFAGGGVMTFANVIADVLSHPLIDASVVV